MLSPPCDHETLNQINNEGETLRTLAYLVPAKSYAVVSHFHIEVRGEKTIPKGQVAENERESELKNKEKPWPESVTGHGYGKRLSMGIRAVFWAPYLIIYI